MIDRSCEQNIIVESDNEESHHRSSRCDSGYLLTQKEGESANRLSEQLPIINSNEVSTNIASQLDRFKPNQLRLEEKDDKAEDINQFHIGNEQTLLNESISQSNLKHSSPRNSQGRSVRNSRNTYLQINGDQQPFSFQETQQQQSRNVNVQYSYHQNNNISQIQNEGTNYQQTVESNRVDLQKNQTQKGSHWATSNQKTVEKGFQLKNDMNMVQRKSLEDNDEPSLQSPAPRNARKQKYLIRKDEGDMRSPELFKKASPDIQNDSWHRSPIAPKPEALSIVKSEPAEVLPTQQSPPLQPFSLLSQQEYNEVKMQNNQLSPSILKSPQVFEVPKSIDHDIDGTQPNINDQNPFQTNICDNLRNESASAIMNTQQNYDEQLKLHKKNLTAAFHRSDCKQNSLARRMLDINVQDYNNTAKFSKGHFALEGLGDLGDGENIYSDLKTERDLGIQTVQLRSKSHQGKSPFGATISTAPAELQAHIDRMRMRSSMQQLPFAQPNSLSPFQKGGRQVQPHFESLYQIQMHQNNQLSAFDAQSQYSAALRSGNPLAQSMTQLHQPLNLTQQHLLLASTKHSQIDQDSQGGPIMNQPVLQKTITPQTTGQQYEVLLKERSDLIDKIDSLQSTVDSQRKQVNEIKSSEAMLRLEISQRTDDLDDSKQAIKAKDKMIQDLKDTLSRQNQQIETLREELTKADARIKNERDSGEKRIQEMREIIQRMKDDYNKLVIGKENCNSDKKQSEKSIDQIQLKIKEIYQLTVELGSIREENNELKKNVEMQKHDFQDRLKEQRERHEIELNKVVDELELYKIEYQEKLDTAQSKIQQQTQKITVGKNIDSELELKQQEWEIQLLAQKQVIKEKQQVCDLQKEEIAQLTTNYRLLNKQLDLLQDQLTKSNANKNGSSQISIRENKQNDKSKILLSTSQRLNNNENQLVDKTRLSLVSPNPNTRQLDQSPEILGQKPGKINENTRKNMIMSSEMQDETQEEQRGQNEDGVYTPVDLSALEDIGLETRRNPIDTEYSRQQQEDGRCSAVYQSSMQIDDPNDNPNHLQNFTDRQSHNPMCYDSLNENIRQSNTGFSNISQKGLPPHQLIARESNNSSEWKYNKTNIQNGNILSASSSQFQTAQQQKVKSNIDDQKSNNMNGIDRLGARSPGAPQTIYQQFRKSNSKNFMGSSNTRMSFTRPSVQSGRYNNTSIQGSNQQQQESSDIGSRLITQRRKQKQGLQSSQSTAILQGNEQTIHQGSSSHRATIISKSSSIHNPMNASRYSGIGQNGSITQGGSGMVKQHGHRGQSNSGINQSLTSQGNTQNQLVQQQPKKSRTRPSMMLGPCQTKAGLTLAQPQYNCSNQYVSSSNLAKQELVSNKLGQTTQLTNSNCKTARQFLQRSPVPQSRQERGGQTARTSKLGQTLNQNRTLYQQKEGQKSAGKIVKQVEKKEVTINSAKRICRSQRMTEYQKKIPSKHNVAGRKTVMGNEPSIDYGNFKDRKESMTLRDASNRLMDTAQHRFKSSKEDLKQYPQFDEANNDPQIYEEAQPFKENRWQGIDQTPPLDMMENTSKQDQLTQNMLDSSGHYVDSSNNDEQVVQEQPQGLNYKMKGRYDFDEDKQFGAVTSREQGPTLISASTTPRDMAAAATARVYHQQPYSDMNESSTNKTNMDDMRMKLQSIQTGKAYLEKKIQEYESRLTQMKVKKDRHTKKMKNM